jgi:hypothetical protein
MNFFTLDTSALIGYAVAYDKETNTVVYFHVDELPSLEVLRQIKQLYPNTTIVLTDSIDDAKRYMGVCDAFRDVLMIAGEPIDRIGLNND